jgi:hypothetical protein
MSRYRLADDPVPSRLSDAAVNPMFPMLAMMFAGAWLAWPWFALNAAALGSPTVTREQRLAALGVLGSLALGLVVWFCWPPETLHEALGERGFRFSLLVLDTWKLGIAYALYALQSRTFAVYEYYGGSVRNGAWVLAAASTFLGDRVLHLFDHELWLIVVS